jgi:hypothetical protein
MIRRLAVTAATAVVLTVPLAGVAMAQTTPVPTPVPVGPECQARISQAVLNALSIHQVPTTPGQVIQYIQFLSVQGQLIRQYCVVIVPSS